MEHVKEKGKQISYRPRPEALAFLEKNAEKTYRSVQGMMDYLMNLVIEMERKGEINLR